MKISIAKTPDEIVEFDEKEFGNVKSLAEAALSSNISTSVFKNGYRKIQNFLFADCIGLDIDNDNKKGTPSLTLGQAKKIFSSFKHVILSTRSHGEEKNGIVADRFRIILFLEYPIVTPNDFYSTWHWLKHQFPWIDNQCKDPSRFWFRHKEILSINEEGTLITPIRYSEPEAPMKDGRPVLPGERGELSKQTLQLLEFGIEPGNRNGSVYKAARDFQQALYEYQEAESRILSSLSRNKVTNNDFTEDEVKLAIRSAYSKEAKHAPRLADIKQRAFSYVRLGDLLETEDKHDDWLVEGLLLKGGVSVVVGVPKIGKTTIVRQLEKNILRGEKFLGRKTTRGSIIHYSFDEKARTAKRHYKALGLNKEDQLILHFGTAANQNYMKELEEDIAQINPALVIIDTLFDMVDTQDVNSYGPIKKQLSFFNNLAEKTNCHIMFIHHQNKPNLNYGSGSGHSVLGSTAIFGSVDCCLIFEKVKDSSFRTLVAMGRAVEDFEKVQLKYDKVTQTYEIDRSIGDIF